MRTYSPKPADIQRVWYEVDADGAVLGRLATEVARVLRGKHKPIFAPHLDTGDHVIVVNAAKVEMTAGKADKKVHYRHSGYPGGLTARQLSRPAGQAARGSRSPGGEGHAPEGGARQPNATEAEGVRRPLPPPLRPGPSAAVRRSPHLPDQLSARRHPFPKEKTSVPIPLIQATGRRKAAVARVRLRPGSGVITVNKRPIDDYFPSATHRMIITEPLRVVEKADVYDVDTTMDGGGVSGQAGALRHGIAPRLGRARTGPAHHPEAGRIPHPRRPREGIEEVRPEEGPQGTAVLEALAAPGSCRCGSAPMGSGA